MLYVIYVIDDYGQYYNRIHYKVIYTVKYNIKYNINETYFYNFVFVYKYYIIGNFLSELIYALFIERGSCGKRYMNNNVSNSTNQLRYIVIHTASPLRCLWYQ